MADNLKLPAGAVPPPAAGSKVQPKKETVRISLPPKTAAKETVRLELPPRSAAAAAPAPAAPAAPRPAAPAVAAPAAAKQTVRLELPPKPGAKAPAVAGEIKLLVPQVTAMTAMAASVSIPDAAEMATMDSSQASPLPAAVKPGGLKGGPPGSRLPGGVVASPGQVGAPPASEQPDATPSAVAVPAIKALPKQAMTSAPISVPPGGVVVRAAGWPDYLLAGLALVTGIAAVVHLLMLIGGGK